MAGSHEPTTIGDRSQLPPQPRTGDEAVDLVLTELRASAGGSLERQIEAGEQVHRILENRLSDLGGE